MKRCLITTIALILFLSANAQEKIKNHISTMQLPSGAKRVAQSDFESHSKKKFTRTVIPAKNSNSFIVDDVLLVSIKELDVIPSTKKSLEKWKSQLEGVYQHSASTWDMSKIDTINGNRFFVFEDHKEDEYNISFYSDDIGNKKLSGFIAFKSKDKEKAHNYLNNLLKNVKLNK